MLSDVMLMLSISYNVCNTKYDTSNVDVLLQSLKVTPTYSCFLIHFKLRSFNSHLVLQ